jgi:hypothetical protein
MTWGVSLFATAEFPAVRVQSLVLPAYDALSSRKSPWEHAVSQLFAVTQCIGCTVTYGCLFFICALPGGEQSYWLTTHDSHNMRYLCLLSMLIVLSPSPHAVAQPTTRCCSIPVSPQPDAVFIRFTPPPIDVTQPTIRCSDSA